MTLHALFVQVLQEDEAAQYGFFFLQYLFQTVNLFSTCSIGC